MDWKRRDPTDVRFQAFMQAYSGLFDMAIRAGTAAQADHPTEAVAELARVVSHENSLLVALWAYLYDGLGYIGYECGYFYGAQPWDELCVARSALELMTEMAGQPPDECADEIERTMATFGYELRPFAKLSAPPGMPVSHWWWFRDEP